MAEPYGNLLDDPARLTAQRKEAVAQEENPMVAELQKAVDAGMNKNWWSRLPKNIGVGVYKAALNTIETGKDIYDAVGTSGADAQAKIEGLPLIPPMNTAPEFFEAAHKFSDEWTANNTLGDDITQGIAQFALPFAAYMRAAGGFQAGATALNVVKGVVAETAATATAFDPHDGRFADLVQLGRESEGRFGELLRKVSPDGSLVNQYINWMTDRENEGEWEGRFKNSVDSLITSGAIGGVLKGAAIGFRAAKKIASDPMKVGRAAQTGSIGPQRPYANVPNQLMGFRRNGVNKTFEEDNFSKTIVVRVKFPNGQTIIDGMSGLNSSHALERARRNWDGAEIEQIGGVFNKTDREAFEAAVAAAEKE